MSLFEKIKSLQLEARKNKNKYETDMLTTILGEISRTVSTKVEVLDKDIHKIVKSMINGIETQAAKAQEKFGLSDNITKLLKDAEYLKKFLPEVMADADIKKIVDDFKNANPSATLKEAMQTFKTFKNISLQKAREFFEGK